MLYHRTERAAGDHCLTVLAEMSDKDRPLAAMVLPPSKGAILPVDLSPYQGVEFEARGGGSFRLLLRWRGGEAEAPFEAGPGWKRIRLPFASFGRPELKETVSLEFVISLAAGRKALLEIDNVRLYR